METSNSNFKFVTTDLLKKVTWKTILHQFTKEKKAFKCEICNYKKSYTQLKPFKWTNWIMFMREISHFKKLTLWILLYTLHAIICMESTSDQTPQKRNLSSPRHPAIIHTQRANILGAIGAQIVSWNKYFQKTNIVDPSLHTPRNNSHGINLGSNPKKELELSKTPSYYLQMHLANFCSVFKQTLPPLRPRVYIMRKYTKQLVI